LAWNGDNSGTTCIHLTVVMKVINSNAVRQELKVQLTQDEEIRKECGINEGVENGFEASLKRRKNSRLLFEFKG